MRHDRHFVDELNRRMGETIGRMLPIDAIEPNPHQPRATLGDLSDLAASVTRHGVLEPLLVRRTNAADTPNGNHYQLISGERRFHAAREAGLVEVPCIVLDVPERDALEITLVENLQRQDLDPYEEAIGYKTLIDAYEYTHEQVASAVARSRVTITESLKLLDLPDDIRELCRHADITAKGVLVEISRLPTPDHMRTLIHEIVDHQLDRAAIRRRRQEMTGEDGTPHPDDTHSPDDLPRRPFVVRLQSPDRPFTMSLSFRTDTEPDTGDIIAALEEMLSQLREDLDALEDS
jgi:ParB family chromosome partitioning protein